MGVSQRGRALGNGTAKRVSAIRLRSTQEFAVQTFKQLEGFGSYGFPESHAASFALIAYASSWMKCWHPDVFCAALLNAQPMGFYAPAQIVRDARDHGVEVRPVCVNASRWDCTLEPTDDESRFAVRLGLRMVKASPIPKPPSSSVRRQTSRSPPSMISGGAPACVPPRLSSLPRPMRSCLR
jgi:Helix-hairpin-helix motif